jgi:hypothetical protein
MTIENAQPPIAETPAKVVRQVQGKPPPTDVFERTYFLLRWCMPVLLLWLVVAMLGVWRAAWRDYDVLYPMTSISAYYYTDARTVFVGVIIGLGALLIVIQGRTPWEDALMNVAGALAPFVALLPTPVKESKTCVEEYCTAEVLKREELYAGIPTNEALIEFNIWAVAPIWAILTGYLAHRAYRAWREPTDPPQAASSTFAAVAVLVFGLIALGMWLFTDRELFFKGAHLTSAAIMVALLLISIIPFARWARPSTKGAFRHAPLKWLRNGFGVYLAVAVLLIVACVVIALSTPTDWNHKVLVVEAAALVPFSVYWIMQGFALRTGDGRAALPHAPER